LRGGRLIADARALLALSVNTSRLFRAPFVDVGRQLLLTLLAALDIADKA